MGRYYWDKKSTAEDYSKSMTIFDLKRLGYLRKSDYAIERGLYWTRNGEPAGNIGLGITL